MGLPKPQPVGQVGIRGVAIFPEGHKLEDKFQLFMGMGCRTAFIPVSPTKVGWFLVWNDSPQGELFFLFRARECQYGNTVNVESL